MDISWNLELGPSLEISWNFVELERLQGCLGQTAEGTTAGVSLFPTHISQTSFLDFHCDVWEKEGGLREKEGELREKEGE